MRRTTPAGERGGRRTLRRPDLRQVSWQAWRLGTVAWSRLDWLLRSGSASRRCRGSARHAGPASCSRGRGSEGTLEIGRVPQEGTEKGEAGRAAGSLKT
eukprot:355368-Chlamydomonas_euryale.AAC.26